MKYLVTLALSLASLLLAPLSQADSGDSYRLGPGDVINIHVYGEEDLSMEVLINNSGKIDYPYLGRLTVTGNTTQKLKDAIENGLRGDYLIHPKVAVNIVSYRQIFINGEVQNPGGYAYQPGLTIEKAVALAGGFTQRASKSNIAITPANGSSGETKVALGARVEPGDIIVVKASFF
ncbi:polysaccharide biosynthesis/export family protein [Aliagarivorans taiwanensis]|uniref:polysaccharide biosynthesis/export family protein n=1 Tax=Aliagarivorans taiwanensis TaxID=561966 RepID=UPI0004006959|nr:polysaccharide biosynthesis/export family protein [Aliagarivorans taiwanensis]